MLGPGYPASKPELKSALWASIKAMIGSGQNNPLRKLYPVHEGFGRTDALGRIGNTAFGDHLSKENYQVGDAPVSYPYLWNIWKFDWVQYNGSVKVVEFTLFGEPFMAMSAGPLDDFNHWISFMVLCDDQAEIDRYWTALSEGGRIEPCGWQQDRYGLSWQITPRALGDMMKDPDRAAAKRAAEAMLTMKKLDLPALKRAFASGKPACVNVEIKQDLSYRGGIYV